jgi:hypothetical protein
MALDERSRSNAELEADNAPLTEEENVKMVQIAREIVAAAEPHSVTRKRGRPVWPWSRPTDRSRSARSDSPQRERPLCLSSWDIAGPIPTRRPPPPRARARRGRAWPGHRA